MTAAFPECVYIVGKKLESVLVKHYDPYYKISLKYALTVILKHQTRPSSKVKKVIKVKFTMMPNSHARLQIITKGLA